MVRYVFNLILVLSLSTLVIVSAVCCRNLSESGCYLFFVPLSSSAKEHAFFTTASGAIWRICLEPSGICLLCREQYQWYFFSYIRLLFLLVAASSLVLSERLRLGRPDAARFRTTHNKIMTGVTSFITDNSLEQLFAAKMRRSKIRRRILLSFLLIATLIWLPSLASNGISAFNVSPGWAGKCYWKCEWRATSTTWQIAADRSGFYVSYNYDETIAGLAYWRLVLACVVLLVSSLIALRRLRSRDPRHCSRCGYDLTGNETGICPECGKGTSSAR